MAPKARSKWDLKKSSAWFSRSPMVRNVKGQRAPRARNVKGQGTPKARNVKSQGAPKARDIIARGKREARRPWIGPPIWRWSPEKGGITISALQASVSFLGCVTRGDVLRFASHLPLAIIYRALRRLY